jgi:SAM-dependent methyltransferase
MAISLDWYSTPLYYDIIFDADTKKEATFLEDVYRLYGKVKGKPAKRVLEPACGSARLMLELAKRGWETYGYDLSPEMVEFSKKRMKKHPSHLWVDRMESFVVPGKVKFPLAHTLVSTFKYLLTEAEAVAHLQHVADSLLQGGIYVLGVHLTDYASSKDEHERWTESRNGVEVVCNIHSWPADKKTRLEKVRSRLRITKDGETKQQETTWHFRTYSAAQLRALLNKIPSLELLDCYDFTHLLENKRELDDSYADCVTILRKR